MSFTIGLGIVGWIIVFILGTGFYVLSGINKLQQSTHDETRESAEEIIEEYNMYSVGEKLKYLLSSGVQFWIVLVSLWLDKLKG